MSKYQDRQKKQRLQRDAQISAWVASGLSKSEIARLLGVSRQCAGKIVSRISKNGS